jgi:hypothetical protein
MENIKNIAKALMEFQAEVEPIPKSKEGYNYKYADLPTILGAINPILYKNGLALTQLIGNEETRLSVHTILIHPESGETLESTVSHDVSEKSKMTSIQQAGSVSTYLRRYSIAAMLNIVTDEDLDGSLERNLKKAQTLTKKQVKEINDLLVESESKHDKFTDWLTQHFGYPILSVEEIPREGFVSVKGKLKTKIFNISKRKIPKPAAFTGTDWIIKFNKYASELWGSDGPEVQDINAVEYCSKHGVDYGNLTQEKAEMLVKRLEEEKQ